MKQNYANTRQEITTAFELETKTIRSEAVKGQQEHIESLQAQNEALKEQKVWMTKDNQFKTEQLATFLAQKEHTETQMYQLRKELI